MRKLGSIETRAYSAGSLAACALALLGPPGFARQATRSPAAPAAPRRPVSLKGDWIGVLHVGENELYLVLHLSQDASGIWHAQLDSLNQAVYGMEASRVVREGDKLQFEIASVGAKFRGALQADHRSIRGVWEQSGVGLPLKFEKRALGTKSLTPAGAVSPLEGTWQGAIEVTNMRMRFQLHLSHDDQRHLLASLDSLDQGILGIPASQVIEKDNNLTFVITAFQAEYHGRILANKDAINGEWIQNDNVEELDFRRSDRPLELRRPQNPVKPYPYREEQVSFASGDGKAALAGTLTVPDGAGPFPAVVLIAGSGPMDRDASISGHKPFWVLADFLTRKGLVVLRYDKRGIAQSTGNYESATMQDLTGDAQAAAAYLSARKEVDPKRLGLLGHGEGGILASLLASRSADVHWLILLAAPATPGEQTLLRQSELIARTGGLPEEQIARSQDLDRLTYAAVRQEKDPVALEKRLNNLIAQGGLVSSMPPAVLQSQVRMMSSPWFRQFLDFDPAPVLQQLKCPVLALNGDRDLQVDADQAVPLQKAAYEKSGNQDFTVMEIEGVNHLLQKAQSGSPALYGAIQETVAPEALNAIARWLAKYTSPLP